MIIWDKNFGNNKKEESIEAPFSVEEIVQTVSPSETVSAVAERVIVDFGGEPEQAEDAVVDIDDEPEQEENAPAASPLSGKGFGWSS
jgi:hypothetical protein